jgi:hypothetical protein
MAEMVTRQVGAGVRLILPTQYSVPNLPILPLQLRTTAIRPVPSWRRRPPVPACRVTHQGRLRYRVFPNSPSAVRCVTTLSRTTMKYVRAVLKRTGAGVRRCLPLPSVRLTLPPNILNFTFSTPAQSTQKLPHEPQVQSQGQ